MVTKAALFAPADRHESGEREAQSTRPARHRLAIFPVGNRPLVLHALEELVSAGVDEVAVVSEDEVADEVQRAIDHSPLVWHAKAHVSVGPNCSFLGALQEVAPWLEGDHFVVHLGDSLRHGGLKDAIADPPRGENDVLALVEAHEGSATPVRAGLPTARSAGIHVFGPGALRLPYDDETPRWDTQVANAAERLATRGGRVELRAVQNWWRHRQRPDTLLQANRFFLSGLQGSQTDAWLENTDLQGPVVIDPTARLSSSTIRGPAIIGPHVEISHAYIGPYTSIGSDVVIENAEVEHSIILPGASIRHLGGRLEASVVGTDARVFRDFRLPRAFRLNVGAGAEVALS